MGLGRRNWFGHKVHKRHKGHKGHKAKMPPKSTIIPLFLAAFAGFCRCKFSNSPPPAL